MRFFQAFIFKLLLFLHRLKFPSQIYHKLNVDTRYQLTPWRNGSASDSRSEGCVFESRRGQRNLIFFFFLVLGNILIADKNNSVPANSRA